LTFKTLEDSAFPFKTILFGADFPPKSKGSSSTGSSQKNSL